MERNLKLLRAAIADDPNDINLIMNLGMELARSGDLAAGLEYYRDAYARMSAQPESECVPELREAFLLTQFTCHLLATRSHEELVQSLQLAAGPSSRRTHGVAPFRLGGGAF